MNKKEKIIFVILITLFGFVGVFSIYNHLKPTKFESFLEKKYNEPFKEIKYYEIAPPSHINAFLYPKSHPDWLVRAHSNSDGDTLEDDYVALYASQELREILEECLQKYPDEYYSSIVLYNPMSSESELLSPAEFIKKHPEATFDIRIVLNNDKKIKKQELKECILDFCRKSPVTNWQLSVDTEPGEYFKEDIERNKTVYAEEHIPLTSYKSYSFYGYRNYTSADDLKM
jgi:serine/threonine protein kinase